MRMVADPMMVAVLGCCQAAIILALIAPSSGFAAGLGVQTTAVSASETRVTYTIRASGAILLTQEERGTFFRSADGDEAIRLSTLRNGQPTSSTRLIHRQKEGKSYFINDALRQYRVSPWSGVPALTGEGDPQSTPAVTRTIAGIKCVAAPLRDGATGQSIGKVWISPEYGVAIRSETDLIDRKTGQAIGLIVEELSDIQTGTAPDLSVFAIPAGYRDISGTGK
jgi:hypothetical protein